jgi:hypothetical protein
MRDEVEDEGSIQGIPVLMHMESVFYGFFQLLSVDMS